MQLLNEFKNQDNDEYIPHISVYFSIRQNLVLVIPYEDYCIME